MRGTYREYKNESVAEIQLRFTGSLSPKYVITYEKQNSEVSKVSNALGTQK